ncbi:MAG: 3-phosphoshikimate 1-carboxyvinyltransferase [Geminicoccaceae bacterium]|nr:3-phosphoshikimate 1-carboxyvinyltransferase [Geminicoccaceae bacterium]
MFAGLAVGASRIEGLLEGEDVMATAGALRRLGVAVARKGDGVWEVEGPGFAALKEPDDVLDMQNAGTGARLLMGILAGCPFTAFMTGDASLRRRPMRRVIEPLSDMGAAFWARGGGRLPLAVRGRGDLLPIAWRSPVASAQVKSAVMLAGLAALGRTTVTEPGASRDHSERMLRAMGAEVEGADTDGGHVVAVAGRPALRPVDFTVPGDPSSAAFPLAASAARPGSRLRLEGVGVNPLRTGLVETLREMGARIGVERPREVAGEPVADLVVEGVGLRGVDVPPGRAPSMIDEYPVLAALAAVAEGTTRMRGLAELRVKESDRLAVMADGLRACGVEAAIEGDDLIVHGRGDGRGLGGASIDARLDHRIAMSFLVLGGLAEAPVRVDGAEAIDTSFPGFVGLMNGLGAAISGAISGEEG